MVNTLKNWLSYMDHGQNGLIRTLTVLGMIICSWIQYIQFGKLNIDTVIYLESAKAMASGNWDIAFEIYNWPFYAWCIANTHMLTSLNFELSAQLLNIIFFGVTTASFLKIIQLSNGRTIEILLGAAVLFSARHIVGAMLTMQLRDEGFWAFFLVSLVFFIRFTQGQRYSDALLWQVSILIATLFRIEGIAYLLFLPFCLYTLKPLPNKLKLFSWCFHLTIIATVVALILMTYFDQGHYINISRIEEIYPSIAWLTISNQFTNKADAFAIILGQYLDHYATISLIVTLIIAILIKSINTIGVVNLSLLTLSLIKRKLQINPEAFRVIVSAICISLLILLFIEIRSFVIVGRYTAPLSFLILLLVPFSMSALWSYRKVFPQSITIVYLCLALFMSVNLYKNIRPTTRDIDYLKQASIWLNQRNQTKAPVLYDNILSRYYADASYIGDLRSDIDYLTQTLRYPEVLNFQYLLINYDDKYELQTKLDLVKSILNNFIEIKRFKHENKDKYVVIYEKKK